MIKMEYDDLKARKDYLSKGYRSIFDHMVFDVVVKCENCKYKCDIENLIISRKKKVLTSMCPICMSTKLIIVDER